MADKTRLIFIKVNPKDNVAIIVNETGVKIGEKFDCGLEVIENIPQSHKIALCDIHKGEEIIRYGEIIGYALREIPKGSWIDETIVELPKAPNISFMSMANKIPESLEPLIGLTFEGYRNADMSVGTKNILGITTSVQCVAGVLNIAVKKIKEQLLHKYKNVDDVVALNHAYGCGVAINAKEAAIPIRTIRNIAKNPNFGGEVLIVSLGCEKLLPNMIFPDLDPSNVIVLQDIEGFESMIKMIMEKAEEKLIILNKRKRELCPVSDLVVGLQCGGSDAFSGVTANPAVGYAADLLVSAGATVLFSEVTEVRDAVHLLLPRAINQEVSEDMKREMLWYDTYLDSAAVDRSANPTPGNKRGGLANIVEKSLGSIAKSGTSAIAEALSPGSRPTKKGLLYAATPASDFVCGTLQIASSAVMQVFTTGRGTPYGLASIPVIKVSSRDSLQTMWPDLIDINAGEIATGAKTIEQVGKELFDFIIEVASGREKTWADKWGIYNDLCLFNPAPIT